jgi:hypothetical protein
LCRIGNDLIDRDGAYFQSQFSEKPQNLCQL